MNSSSDTGSPTPAAIESGGGEDHFVPPLNWREALMALIASRLALIQLESKDAAKDASSRAGLVAIACGCTFFAWALLLAGGVSLVSERAEWPWDQVAIGAAFIHLVVALIFACIAKASPKASFPVTRAEFQKDREWIENFQKTKKSDD